MRALILITPCAKERSGHMRPVGSVASLHAAEQSFVMESCVCGNQHTWISSHGEVVVGSVVTGLGSREGKVVGKI